MKVGVQFRILPNSEIDRDKNAGMDLRGYAMSKISSLGTWEVNDRGNCATLRETLKGLCSEEKSPKTEGKAAAKR